MKQKILLSAGILFSIMAHAQKPAKVYAITTNEHMQWMNISLVDANTGQLVKKVFDYNQQVSFLNAVNNTPAAQRTEGAGPTGSMVAAAAFDRMHSKLFFIPMRIGELRWADMRSSTPKFYTLTSPALSHLNMNDDANHFTKMAIGADGSGYAVTNDGNHLIRFSTGKNTTVTDLGNLVDDETNGNVSVHNRCTSWGGDMIAADDGSFYMFTHRNHVFQFNPQNRIAKHLGSITGLPENFTSNGAAVTEDGNVIISCGYGNQQYYKIDLQTLAATPAFANAGGNISASDLASSNLLPSGKKNNVFANSISEFTAANHKIAVYPNPVRENRFYVNFEVAAKGEHTVQVLDLSGKIIMNRVVNIINESQLVPVNVNPGMVKGLYMVKVISAEKKTVFAGKMVIQ
jgi:hypothetical protein